ncbi:MAG: TetR/AcrR family transcriptional regulator [Halanaerobiaceae bacterium]
MPRHFSKEERKNIKNKLIEKGKKYFAKTGLKKTTVAELAAEVGIGKGTFYNFFQSKEDLYFTVVQIEGEKLRNEIKSVVDKKGQNDITVIIKNIMDLIFNAAANNPLLNRVFTTDDLNKVFRKLGPEKIKEHNQLSTDAFLPLIKEWKKEEKLIEEDPEVILGIIRAVIIVGLHKKEIGDDIFPGVINRLIEFTAAGLTKR